MSKFAAVKLGESIEMGITYSLNQKMIDDAPHFETQREANKYCDMINPHFLWAIVPLNLEPMSEYDSTQETQNHIDKVEAYLQMFSGILEERGQKHDASKLESPEKEYFDRYTHRLATLTFGSEEYTKNIQDLKPALDHHYANNSHHPQFYENGVNGMNLFDVVEMFCDWKAAGERGKNGDIFKSIDINSERFGISKQLKSILINTAKYLWDERKSNKETN